MIGSRPGARSVPERVISVGQGAISLRQDELFFQVPVPDMAHALAPQPVPLAALSVSVAPSLLWPELHGSGPPPAYSTAAVSELPIRSEVLGAFPRLGYGRN